MPTRRTGKGTVAIIGDDGTRAGQTPQTTDRDLTAKEVAELKSLLARARTATGVKIKHSDTDPSEVAIDHPDRVVGSALLMQAIGTRDSDFLHGLMSQLVAVNDDCGEADAHRINFMLSVIKGLKPRANGCCPRRQHGVRAPPNRFRQHDSSRKYGRRSQQAHSYICESD
jgi:hypothetical protein